MRNMVSLETLNRQAADPARMVEEADRLYNAQIDQVCDRLQEIQTARRIVLLSGPTSSGKTTTSRILHETLLTRGVHSLTVSIDDFFKPRQEAPLLPNGERDHECIEAINLEDLHRCISALLHDGYAELPRFDFLTGAPAPERHPVRMEEGEVLMLEGIHAIHPLLSGMFSQDGMLRVFVSVTETVTKQGDTFFDPVQLRFLRRLIRDYHFRNSCAENTYRMWPQVRHGEHQYIEPYISTVDIRMNTFFSYELGAMAADAERILRQIPADSEWADEARQLCDKLEEIRPVPTKFVPAGALIREFIGLESPV